MSHYTTVRTRLVDGAALLAALADLGFPMAESYAEAQPLYGYMGDVRPERAHIVIPRSALGRSANDIGFHFADGGYTAIISAFDAGQGYDAAWLNRLHQRYAYHTSVAALAAQGFRLVEETTENGSIHLTMRRAL